MRRIRGAQWLVIVGVLVVGAALWIPGTHAAGKTTFQESCAQQYQETGKCPEDICWEKTVVGADEKDEILCLPRECPDISADACPQDYCAVMVNCSNEKICHYQMRGERAQCGDLAYEGQDVECCPGLIRRCGIEFLDGTCDMEGRGSIYSLPICIPCGDGFCTNFESRCNCPED
ncbi:MAG TPA: hypothetical protein PLT76_08520, partial [Candidatus Omnitrophota bacterium]|nr:hypothetical protein [Candidatus Omnitrophota bacterium]